MPIGVLTCIPQVLSPHSLCPCVTVNIRGDWRMDKGFGCSVLFKKTRMRQIIIILIIGLFLISCQSKRITSHEQTLIIGLTIDSALVHDSGLNTNNYWIDFSNTDIFERQAINDFLKQRTNFVEINSDSLLRNDSTWIKYGFLQKMLIKFKKLDMQGDSLIIDLDKIKATDGSNGIQTILKKKNKQYKVISSKMTWIS